MTDLEMTRLCAEAMGYSEVKKKGDKVHDRRNGEGVYGIYWPIEDDAQALALVKKFTLLNDWHPKLKLWSISMRICGKDFESVSPDLNRAIVECVAKMQKEKASA